MEASALQHRGSLSGSAGRSPLLRLRSDEQLIAMNDVLINDVVIIPEVNRAADTFAVSNTLNPDNLALGPFEINYWNIANWNRVAE